MTRNYARLVSVEASLTMRDEFAIAALQGLLAKNRGMDESAAARIAYQYADAMLMERNRQ